MKQLIFSLTFLLIFTSSAFSETMTETQKAMKLKPNIDEGKKIYALCATCHSENGWGKEDGSFPVISGQHKSVVIKQLADIRARNRDNPTMFPFTGDDVLGGAQGISDVAGYIESLPLNLNPAKGNGKQLALGKKLFTQNCIACHGEKGEGNADTFFPRIQGQHYAYLLRQLQWIRDGRRKNANSAMLALIKEMDDDAFSAVADYISRIEVLSKNKENDDKEENHDDKK